MRYAELCSYSQSDLFVVDAAPGSTPRNLTTACDYDVNDGIGGDQATPRGQNPTPIVWSQDQSSVIVVAAEHGSANLKRVTVASGKIDAITDAQQAVMAYSATPDASKIVATISTQTNIGDLAIVERCPETAAPQRRSVARAFRTRE